MDCALCFCAEALFFPPSQLTRHWNEKKPQATQKKQTSPNCLHIMPKLLRQAQRRTRCVPTTSGPRRRGAAAGHGPGARQEPKRRKLKLRARGLDVHTCANSPRDGDAHPICQHSAKHTSSPHSGPPRLPFCLRASLCSMTCEQTRS